MLVQHAPGREQYKVQVVNPLSPIPVLYLSVYLRQSHFSHPTCASPTDHTTTDPLLGLPNILDPAHIHISIEKTPDADSGADLKDDGSVMPPTVAQSMQRNDARGEPESQ